jgi:hypothetical protein
MSVWFDSTDCVEAHMAALDKMMTNARQLTEDSKRGAFQLPTPVVKYGIVSPEA